jgi:hypothetical protein
MQCWLCLYNTHSLAVEMNQFVQDNIGTMDLDTLAIEVGNALSSSPDIGTCSISTKTIKDHITSHTLNPAVRLGVSLRSLLELSDKVKGDLHKTDATGQNLGLDPKMIDAYIRLQSQILNVYKSETNRMLFSTTSRNN